MTTAGDDLSELGVLVRWLIEYAEKPIDRELVKRSEQKALSTKTLLSLGHSSALVAVLGKIKEVLRARDAG